MNPNTKPEPDPVFIDDPHPDRAAEPSPELAARFASALRASLGEKGAVAFAETAWRQETGDPIADIKAALAQMERLASEPLGPTVLTRGQLDWLTILLRGTSAGDDLADFIASLEAVPQHLRPLRSGVASSLPGVLAVDETVLQPGVVEFMEQPRTAVARVGSAQRRAKRPTQSNREGARVLVPDSMVRRGTLLTVNATNRKMRRAR